MSDDVEKQVERAYQRHHISTCQASFGMHEHIFKEIARDLLAGKFKEEELPEITRPPWPCAKPRVIYLSAHGIYHVFCESEYSAKDHWVTHLIGPNKASERAAIEAWNAVFAVHRPTVSCDTGYTGQTGLRP